MSTAQSLNNRVEVQPGELDLGKPLPWALYGKNGILVAPAGFVISDDAKRRSLLEAGVFRELQRLRMAFGKPGNARPDDPDGDDVLGELRHNVEFARLSITLRGESEITVSTEYLGKLPGQLLLVTAPPLPGRHTWRDVAEGTLLRLRLLTGRSAYSFETPLVRFTALPSALLFLRYPTHVQHQQVRNNVRVRTRLKAVALMAGGTRVPVVVENISGDGCGLETESILGELGTAFDLVFRIEVLGQSYTLTLPSLIRNRRTRKGREITGVAFAHPEAPMDTNLRMALEAYLYEQIVAE